MVTCYIKYVIDPKKVREFEKYAKLWIPLVAKFGGQHHGYFLPSEGASNIDYAKETDCIISYERSFFKPVFE